MDTALPQKFPFILDRNLAKANCTGNRSCTSCDIVVLELSIKYQSYPKTRKIELFEQKGAHVKALSIYSKILAF